MRDELCAVLRRRVRTHPVAHLLVAARPHDGGRGVVALRAPRVQDPLVALAVDEAWVLVGVHPVDIVLRALHVLRVEEDCVHSHTQLIRALHAVQEFVHTPHIRVQPRRPRVPALLQPTPVREPVRKQRLRRPVLHTLLAQLLVRPLRRRRVCGGGRQRRQVVVPQLLVQRRLLRRQHVAHHGAAVLVHHLPQPRTAVAVHAAHPHRNPRHLLVAHHPAGQRRQLRAVRRRLRVSEAQGACILWRSSSGACGGLRRRGRRRAVVEGETLRELLAAGKVCLAHQGWQSLIDVGLRRTRAGSAAAAAAAGGGDAAAFGCVVFVVREREGEEHSPFVAEGGWHLRVGLSHTHRCGDVHSVVLGNEVQIL
eukprot:Rhum_TRINITY_DN14030_c0_g1::Rhum_TRINITY_DN14030_c0_g1_i3::g.67663::m.67663